ncbi:AAA family ATPase [Corynebacterium hansenii]|uniref:AAA family ATPase n=1 Tax=Corynebacterium hansenii TaxID=394964 RepID=A0ABV7ZKV9_9CORY|nr:AAA family ATPase [Corynebacterium hansenii]WJY99388.1 5-methylcytosine-specific restriction enzyme B [Corynebacterium hansenii]
MPTESSISSDAKNILKALATRKNVIITGPPGTGKSRLLNEIRELFKWDHSRTGSAPTGAIPVPAELSPIPAWFPSPDQIHSREVFQTVFDQNTKYRDFMRGLVPKVGEAGVFEVTSGTLHRAALKARIAGNAALVIVDEINRGPAVAAFGSALVGLEPDKRLPTNGEATNSTQFFEILGDQGNHESFALPTDLYILAAMNEADTSVEPLDVAFLRRWHIHRLEPDESVLRTHFNLGAPTPLPDKPLDPGDYYESLVQAFTRINEQIMLGRGAAYQLGHGALMHASPDLAGLRSAEEYVATAWATLRGHVDEVFYGNTRAISDILRAESSRSVYSLSEQLFAGQRVRRIIGPLRPSASELYKLLMLIATD